MSSTPPTATLTATSTPTSKPQWSTPTPGPTLTPTPVDLFWLKAPLVGSTPVPSPTASGLLGSVAVPGPTDVPAAAFRMPFFGEGAPATPTSPVQEEPIPAIPTRIVATGDTQAVLTIPGRMRISGPIGATDSPETVRSEGRSIPTPPPIRYAGVPTTSSEAAWLTSSRLWLGIPHRSQFDGTFYAETNCGPASIGMVLEAYGLRYATDAIRGEVNRFQGSSSPDEGTSLGAIALVAQRAGLHPWGLSRRWTIDELPQHLKEGRPIISLVRFADLPGNGGADPGTNHYIILSGMSGDQFIYNDSAYVQGSGRALLISPEVLKRAWDNSVIPGHAVAFSLNASGAGLLAPGRLSPPPVDAAAFAEGTLEAPEFAAVVSELPTGQGGSQQPDSRNLELSITTASASASGDQSDAVFRSSIAAAAASAMVGVGLLLILAAAGVLMLDARSRREVAPTSSSPSS